MAFKISHSTHRRHSFVIRALSVAALITIFAGCTSDTRGENPLILVSIDGFRWDYLGWAETPVLDSLASVGVKAEGLIPAFPSTTYPNHYTIVTGLYPENHGLVANTMFDPIRNETYSLSNRNAVGDGRWYEGEPIWVTAENNGVTAGIMFWPGSEAEIAGVRPSYWKAYDQAMQPVDVVDSVLRWLDLPLTRRPKFLTIYFHMVDDAGHRQPDSAGVALAIQQADSALGLLFEGLRERKLLDAHNIIVTADHGMAAVDSSRLVFLDDYLDPELINVTDWAPALAIRPTPENLGTVYASLKGAHPNMRIYRRDEIPAKYHYTKHFRIPPIVGILDPGWQATTRAKFAENPDSFSGGAHGFDPEAKDMHALFIGAGPSFQNGVTVPAFQNIHIYELMCALLGIEPAVTDGSLDAVRGMLKE